MEVTFRLFCSPRRMAAGSLSRRLVGMLLRLIVLGNEDEDETFTFAEAAAEAARVVIMVPLLTLSSSPLPLFKHESLNDITPKKKSPSNASKQKKEKIMQTQSTDWMCCSTHISSCIDLIEYKLKIISRSFKRHT
jgi:PleD family two-component response regulator